MRHASVYGYKMINKNYHIVGTIPKSIQKIVETKVMSLTHVFMTAQFPGLVQAVFNWIYDICFCPFSTLVGHFSSVFLNDIKNQIACESHFQFIIWKGDKRNLNQDLTYLPTKIPVISLFHLCHERYQSNQTVATIPISNYKNLRSRSIPLTHIYMTASVA